MREKDSRIEEGDELDYIYTSDEDCDDGGDEIWYIAEDEISPHEGEEQRLTNTAFVHGMSYSADRHAALATMKGELYQGDVTKFKGIFLDTCANRFPFISYNQYKAYCDSFHVPSRLEENDKRRLTVIGGTKNAIGTTTIPIPFNDLQLVIYVQFQIIPGNGPNLLSMKDMIENCLEISIQKLQVMYKHPIQPLTFQDYFLVQKWEPDDLYYSL